MDVEGSWGLQSWGNHHTFVHDLSFPLGKAEDPTRIPWWFWQGKGKNNHCDICPGHSPQASLTFQERKKSPEPYPIWDKGQLPIPAPSSFFCAA